MVGEPAIRAQTAASFLECLKKRLQEKKAHIKHATIITILMIKSFKSSKRRCLSALTIDKNKAAGNAKFNTNLLKLRALSAVNTFLFPVMYPRSIITKIGSNAFNIILPKSINKELNDLLLCLWDIIILLTRLLVKH